MISDDKAPTRLESYLLIFIWRTRLNNCMNIKWCDGLGLRHTSKSCYNYICKYIRCIPVGRTLDTELYHLPICNLYLHKKMIWDLCTNTFTYADLGYNTIKWYQVIDKIPSENRPWINYVKWYVNTHPLLNSTMVLSKRLLKGYVDG